MPAGLKLGTAMGLILGSVLIPAFRWDWLGLMAILVILLAWASTIPWSFIIRRVIFLELFVAGIVLMALFQPGGWRLMLFILSKCSLCLLVTVLLSNTTPFSDIIRILKRLHFPSLLLTTLSLMYRYLFVLMDESQRMKRARMSRTFTPHHNKSWHVRSSIVSQLFIRASERAERIYGAMCARGWK